MEWFAGARARLDRAQEQTQVLHTEFREFAARSPHAVREMYDAETGRKRAEYLVLEELPDAWSAVVGEIAYDLRAALDHAVYDLTCIESGGPLGQTGFPIFEAEERYGELTTRGEPAVGCPGTTGCGSSTFSSSISGIGGGAGSGTAGG